MILEEDNITWTETAPGYWERGLDEGEKNYTTLATLFEGSGRVFFAITAHLSVQIRVLEGEKKEAQSEKVDRALRNAWLASRYDYPAIASQIIYSPERPFFRKIYRTLKSGEDIETWLKDTFVSVSSGQTGVEFANADPPVPKLPTVFVLSPPSPDGVIRRDLVLRSPHELIDGIGTMHLWNNLVRHAAQIYEDSDSWQAPALDGTESRLLSPPYRTAAKIPSSLTETQQKKIDAIAAELTASNEGLNMMSVPFTRGSLVPGKHQRIAIKFSRHATTCLLKASSDAQVTVTHAFHAAIAMAVRHLQPAQKEPTKGRYASWVLRNERAHCHEPYNSAKHAAAVYHSISGRAVHIDLDLPVIGSSRQLGYEYEEGEFFRTVRQFKAFYESLRDDPDHYILVCAICTLFTPPVPDAELAPNSSRPVPGPRDLPSVSLSSIGNIDSNIEQTHGRFEVYEPWVTGEELGNGYGLFLGTFRGELCLSGVYNDAWHGPEEMNNFLEHCKTLVLKGFGLLED
ncbi:hypothetical protein FDECE_4880 [Fusarium decemcellulare]|nr:hypothetical protein FDECE_4880 [Fusarium decemcellulare]